MGVLYMNLLAVVFFSILFIVMASKGPRKPKKRRQGTPGNYGRSKAKDIRELRRNMEDRNSDWLALQRKEEKACEAKLASMFGIRSVHPINCDARRLQMEHSLSCEDKRVDTGDS